MHGRVQRPQLSVSSDRMSRPCQRSNSRREPQRVPRLQAPPAVRLLPLDRVQRPQMRLPEQLLLLKPELELAPPSRPQADRTAARAAPGRPRVASGQQQELEAATMETRAPAVPVLPSSDPRQGPPPSLPSPDASSGSLCPASSSSRSGTRREQPR